ncbi:MAG: CoA activase, partial [Planctomycetota bacterium]
QGAIAIPVDSYPVDDDVPIFQDMFWAQGQRILRAAHQIRRTPGVYSLFASNYSCGPDSFSVHFYAYMMEGKPFAMLETDGHSGDAGTRTRVEAFLHCVREDLRAGKDAEPNDFQAIERARTYLPEMRRDRDRVLIPRMGPAAEALASCLRGLGIPAETLPLPDRESVRLGRRYTSGKECVPMCITLGSLLQRIERDRGSNERFTFFMPTSPGPCRFGTYQLLHKIVLERLDWKDRVRTWSPTSEGYFDGVPQGFASLVFSGVMATDLLLAGLHDVRPAEREPGLAQRIHDKYVAELHHRLEGAAAGDISAPSALWEVGTGRLFGVADLLARAAAEFAAAREPLDLPTVLVVGEIYVRCDPFANDFVVDRLEERGIRVKFAPFSEWIEYIDHVNLGKPARQGFGERLKSFVQRRIQAVAYATVASRLGWPERSGVVEALSAASPYLRSNLEVESVLTVGAAAHEWREGHIDAVVSVGPLECMPNKIAEAQFFHVAEKEGLLSLTVSLNGDPVDPEILDSFAYEVRERFRARQEGHGRTASSARTHRLWQALGRRWAPVAPGTMPFHVFAKRRGACHGACAGR